MELSNYPCLSIGEAVHYYDLSAKQIKQDIKSGKIPAVKMVTDKGRRWRIFPSGVPSYIEETLHEQHKSQQEIQELTLRLQDLQLQVVELQQRLENTSLAASAAENHSQTAVVAVDDDALDVVAIDLKSNPAHPIVQFLNRILQPLKGQPIEG